MINVSLCMIVRDKEEVIAQCLDSVQGIVDEIIIVDTGSVDNTKKIANRYNVNIYDFNWNNDFSAARNYSFSKATKEYILWLDAEDLLLPEDRNKFKILKEGLDSSIDMVIMKYNLGIDETGRVLCSYKKPRLIKRNGNIYWQEPVYEYINLSGKIICADIAVTCKKVKNKSVTRLNIFEKMIKIEGELSHRNYFYYARELTMNERYDQAKIYYEKFLSEEMDSFFNYMEACILFSKIYAFEDSRNLAIKTLLRSFEFGIPRAEICCELGNQYKELKDYYRAIEWFEVASKIKKPENIMGVVIHDCYNYIPYAEISICFLNLGLLQEAINYNEKAALFKPDSLLVINNRKIFEVM